MGVSRARELRELLISEQLHFLMEAHNGLSARIASEAGFKAVWASGLALSAQFGVRDSNEASWTQIVDMVEFMVDASTVPILLDGDTGFGNFNNLRRLVRKLEQRGVAGVCVEDKVFPKSNSFLKGERQPLADIEEFCGKIRAGKDSQVDPDFCLIARTEALIAGWGLEEALRRAEAYRQAGADGILIHSSRNTADEVLEFALRWEQRAPLIVVPTTYYSTPTDRFREAGVSLVIWANHLLRASIEAMQVVARQISEAESVVRVEDGIAPLGEVFRLQGAGELARAESLYTPTQEKRNAVVLAATRGEGLDVLTEDKPKGMLSVGGRPLLEGLIHCLKTQGVHDLSVVVGYRAESVDIAGVSLIHNPQYQTTGELYSLWQAREKLDSDTVILYGDLLFRNYILRDFLDLTAALTVLVDSAPGEERDVVCCSRGDDRSPFAEPVTLSRIANRRDELDRADGRFVGMLSARGEGVDWLRQALVELHDSPDFEELGLPELLNYLLDSGRTVEVHYIHGHWLDVNTLSDFERAQKFQPGWSVAFS